MTLPILVKTWQFNVNQTIPALGTGTQDLQRAVRTVINSLLGFGSGAPTVLGSSDSSTAGLDTVNRWTTDGALVWNSSGVHSWIVLKQTGIAANFQICFDLSASNAGSMAAYFSPSAGFTGGSTSARPTATDEVQFLGTGGSPTNYVSSAADMQRVWHVMMTSDGSVMRVLAFTGNSVDSGWFIEKPPNSNPSWTVPAVAYISSMSGADGSLTYGVLNGSSGANFWGAGPSGAMNFNFTTEGFGGQAVGQNQATPNGLDGSYPFTNIGLWSVTSGMKGRHGTLVDLWFGSTTPATQDTYPNDASRQFVQVGDLIYPWNGTVMSIA